ncbi:MAG: hypothetical protein ACYTGN_04905 [Planctomycetota bacterium]|jgi:hypothetical protein
MSANRVACALLGLLVFGIGGLPRTDAAPKGRTKPVEVPFIVLLDGQSSWIDFPLQQAVRDQDAWESLWSSHADSPTCGFTSPPPLVDFGNDMVVAVFLGMRGNTAYSVRIDRVTPTAGGGYLVEYVEEEVQAKNLVFSDILTAPFVFALVPRTDGEVAFLGTKVIVKRRK